MNTRRNDPCSCGSGRKYKRCCLERDEARERDQRATEMERYEPAVMDEMASALTPSLRAVVAKDGTVLGRLLDRFANALRTDDLLANVRFDDSDFCAAVEPALSQLGGARGSEARARLFQIAMRKLGDRRAVRKLHDQLSGVLGAATSGPSDREAVAAALVCMQPVLARRAMPASKSPTLEIIFDIQLEAWMKGRDVRDSRTLETVERSRPFEAR